jgi:hypothetical protein
MTIRKIFTRKKSTPTVKKDLPVRATQNQISDKNPSEVTDAHWVYAYRLTGKYPDFSKNSGKWLVFVSVDNVDVVWGKIKLATETGLLGGVSKVATARPSSNATNKNVKVICVYSYDHTDKDDVTRIRQELRKIGIENKIPYKTDNATQQGRYQVKGDSRMAVHYE